MRLYVIDSKTTEKLYISKLATTGCALAKIADSKEIEV